MRESRCLCRRWKYARRRRRSRCRLTWPHPGVAWAIDATLLAGAGIKLLVVRDLASRMTLAAAPIFEESGDRNVRLLASLFARHGAPLVLKRDNGSPFSTPPVDALLDDAGVLPLNSPPRCPRYNGAAERGIGVLKLAIQAALPLPGDPLAHALHHVNHRICPWGWRGPSPAQRWDERAPVLPVERARLADEVAQHFLRHMRESATNDRAWKPSCRDMLRYATRDSLVDLQYLFIERA